MVVLPIPYLLIFSQPKTVIFPFLFIFQTPKPRGRVCLLFCKWVMNYNDNKQFLSTRPFSYFTAVADDEVVEAVEDVDAVGLDIWIWGCCNLFTLEMAPVLAPLELDEPEFELEVGLEPTLLASSSFLAARVTSGDSGLNFRRTLVKSDLTTEVMTSDWSPLSVHVTINVLPPWPTRVGIEIASRPFFDFSYWSSQLPSPAPSLLVGLGGGFGLFLARFMGDPGKLPPGPPSFQRPDWRLLHKFLM